MRKSLVVMLIVVLLGWVAVERATAQQSVETRGAVTVLTIPSTEQEGAGIDFVHAQPMELPSIPGRSDAEAREDLINTLMSPPVLGTPGYSPGKQGDGRTHLIELGVPSVPDSGGVTPEEFGTNNHPFDTARADLNNLATNKSYPYEPAGRLFFNIGTAGYECSASLIKRGVVVTAAHCVANFGKKMFYSNWVFIPGYRAGAAPFGMWTAKFAVILTAYYNGTDPCAVSGIVCQDDVAVLLLNPSGAGGYPGTSTGWYGYGWNGYGFTGSGMTQISQLGLPACLDNGLYLERNDSYGYTSASLSHNTVIGSLMCGGSSGGPWVVNLGIRPALTGTTAGTAAAPNIVVGVTSWGYVSTAPKEMGAAPFLSTNILPLINAACSAVPGACS